MISIELIFWQLVIKMWLDLFTVIDRFYIRVSNIYSYITHNEIVQWLHLMRVCWLSVFPHVGPACIIWLRATAVTRFHFNRSTKGSRQKKTVKKRSGWPLGLTPPPPKRSGKCEKFWIWVLTLVYDYIWLITNLTQQFFLPTDPPLTPPPCGYP